MVRTRFAGVIVVMFAILACTPARALAQGDSGIAGVVKDTTGAVLPGVTVEATSPVLIEKMRSVATDDQGQYKILNLRPGTYSVTFTLQGFNTVKRGGVELTTGFTAAVNAELAVGTVQETVTVSSAAPVVDIQNVRQQQVVTNEVIEALPTGRTIQSLAQLIPGMRVNSGGSNVQDVGGLLGEGASIVIHGGRANDMQLLLNGLPFNNTSGTWTSNIRPNTGEAQEFNYQLGANSAEYQTGGVVMNLIPKEGGNRFSGSLFTNWANDKLQSNNLTNALQARGLKAVNGLDHIWDINLSAGGPLRNNTLWLFGSFRYWGVDNLLAGVFHSADLSSFVYMPDLSRQAHDRTWTLNESLRLTWQITPKQKVSVYIVNQPRASYGGGSALSSLATGIIRTPEALAYQHIPRNQYGQINWTAPLTNKVLVEAGVGIYRQNIYQTTSPGVTPDNWSIVDSGKNIAYGAPSSLTAAISAVNTYRAALSYVTGSHALKFGSSLQAGTAGPDTRVVFHDIDLTFLNGTPSSITLNTTPYALRENLNAALALFAQDQWTVKRLTVNAGVRFDYLNSSVPAQHVPAAQFVGARDFPEVPGVPSWKDLSPRLGFSYDLFGSGKTALKWTLSHYVGSELTSLARANEPLNTSVNTATRTWTPPPGVFIPQCDFLNPNPNGDCSGRLSDVNFGKPTITTVYDPAVLRGFGKRPDNWETSFGIQHELLSHVAVNASYFHRSYGNFIATHNQDVTPANYDPYCITAPQNPQLPGGGGQQICGLYDINPLKFNQIHNLVTFADKYGKQTETYDGVDLTVNARLPRGVLLQGGLNMGRTKTNSCFVIDSPQALRFCDVRPPFQPQVKFLGSYRLPWDVQLAGVFQSVPGPQITATYTARNAEIFSSLHRNLASGVNGTAAVELIPPGTLFGDRLYQFDARVSKNVSVVGRRVEGMVDLYNVFNASPVLQLNTVYGLTGSTWLRPAFVLPGRLVKFGVQINF